MSFYIYQPLQQPILSNTLILINELFQLTNQLAFQPAFQLSANL